MHARPSPKPMVRLLCGLAAAFLCSGCGNAPSPLLPAGANAQGTVDLLWILMAIGGGVSLIVTLLMLVALRSGRRGPDPAPVDQGPGRRFVLIAGGVIPAIILLITFGLTLKTMAQLDETEEPVLRIEAIGHQWWWEFRYPDAGFVTANEIYIPVGQPVRVDLTSADVIHSFWIPELHGVRDMIPGRIHEMTLHAEREGTFRGECTEFCGLQHAKMQFLVIAVPSEEFETWSQAQAQDAPPPDDTTRAGYDIYFDKGCDECHRIAGTEAQGLFGPDLTHLMSRQTLAAGWLENNRGTLGGWIADPQAIKWGAIMPPTEVSGSELQALLDYLESLK